MRVQQVRIFIPNETHRVFEVGSLGVREIWLSESSSVVKITYEAGASTYYEGMPFIAEKTNE